MKMKMKMKIIKKNTELSTQPLNGDYIAGLVQADGSFSCRVTKKTRNSKTYLGLSVIFTLVQKQEHKDIVLAVQKAFKGTGNWYIAPKDKTIRYQVTKISDFHNIVIPFFLKHNLKSGKLHSFLIFKYIVETMYKREHWKNEKILLSLIVLASHLNPLGKMGNNIRYLNQKDQKLVINNIQPEGVDLTSLFEEIKAFKSNPLSLDFLNGLIDGDGSLSVYFTKRANNMIYPCLSFVIVQDIHNLSLLEEIKSYWGLGNINRVSAHAAIYRVQNPGLIKLLFGPFGLNQIKINRQKEWIMSDSNKTLPIIKRQKFIHSAYILAVLQDPYMSNEEKIDSFFYHSYFVSSKFSSMKLEEYVKERRKKYINEDIV